MVVRHLVVVAVVFVLFETAGLAVVARMCSKVCIVDHAVQHAAAADTTAAATATNVRRNERVNICWSR